MSKVALCIHAHFYQPPRANPLSGLIGAERSATPFRNWNERAAEEVYRPNAGLSNFELLSFDMNESLLSWLRDHSQKTYAHILDAVCGNAKTRSSANVLAVPFHQSPLPSLTERDRLTQLRWGAAATKAHFGSIPKGVFLPGFAVDMPTLQSLVDAGFKYTLLRETQVTGVPIRRGGAGPYRIKLPSGDSIDVFLVHEELSASMVKEMVERGGAGYWARRELGCYNRHAGPLTALYVDGEMLGQHNMAEAHFLYYLLRSEVPAVAYRPTSLEAYYETAPKIICEVELLPHEADPQTEFDQSLRCALETLKTEADLIFEDVLGAKAWILRDEAFSLEVSSSYRHLLDSQFYLQQAMANMTGLDHYIQLSYKHILDDTSYAISLIKADTGTDLGEIFARALPQDLATNFVTLQEVAVQQMAV